MGTEEGVVAAVPPTPQTTHTRTPTTGSWRDRDSRGPPVMWLPPSRCHRRTGNAAASDGGGRPRKSGTSFDGRRGSVVPMAVAVSA